MLRAKSLTNRRFHLSPRKVSSSLPHFQKHQHSSGILPLQKQNGQVRFGQHSQIQQQRSFSISTRLPLRSASLVPVLSLIKKSVPSFGRRAQVPSSWLVLNYSNLGPTKAVHTTSWTDRTNFASSHRTPLTSRLSGTRHRRFASSKGMDINWDELDPNFDQDKFDLSQVRKMADEQGVSHLIPNNIDFSFKSHNPTLDTEHQSRQHNKHTSQNFTKAPFGVEGLDQRFHFPQNSKETMSNDLGEAVDELPTPHERQDFEREMMQKVMQDDKKFLPFMNKALNSYIEDSIFTRENFPTQNENEIAKNMTEMKKKVPEAIDFARRGTERRTADLRGTDYEFDFYTTLDALSTLRDDSRYEFLRDMEKLKKKKNTAIILPDLQFNQPSDATNQGFFLTESHVNFLNYFWNVDDFKSSGKRFVLNGPQGVGKTNFMYLLATWAVLNGHFVYYEPHCANWASMEDEKEAAQTFVLNFILLNADLAMTIPFERPSHLPKFNWDSIIEDDEEMEENENENGNEGQESLGLFLLDSEIDPLIKQDQIMKILSLQTERKVFYLFDEFSDVEKAATHQPYWAQWTSWESTRGVRNFTVVSDCSYQLASDPPHFVRVLDIQPLTRPDFIDAVLKEDSGLRLGEEQVYIKMEKKEIDPENPFDDAPHKISIPHLQHAEFLTGRLPGEIQFFRRDKEHYEGSRSEHYRFSVLNQMMEKKWDTKFKLYTWLLQNFMPVSKNLQCFEQTVTFGENKKTRWDFPEEMRESQAFYIDSGLNEIRPVSGLAYTGLVPHFKHAFQFFKDAGFHSPTVLNFLNSNHMSLFIQANALAMLGQWIDLQTVLPLSKSQNKEVNVLLSTNTENVHPAIRVDPLDYVVVDKLEDLQPNPFNRKRLYLLRHTEESRKEFPFDYFVDSPDSSGTTFFKISHSVPTRNELQELEKFAKSSLLKVMKQLRKNLSDIKETEFKIVGLEAAVYRPVSTKGVTSPNHFPDPKTCLFQLQMKGPSQAAFSVVHNIYFVWGCSESNENIRDEVSKTRNKFAKMIRYYGQEEMTRHGVFPVFFSEPQEHSTKKTHSK